MSKRRWSYLCLYAKDSTSGVLKVLTARKNQFSHWFDTDAENVAKGDRVLNLKHGQFKVYPRQINGHYFAFYPERNGYPLENGAGEACIVGGEVKASNLLENVEERMKANAVEEFWEETGFHIDSITFLHDHFYLAKGKPFGIYFVEVSAEQLEAVATQISHNYNIVKTVDIPRVRALDLSIEPTVWSNEIASVEIMAIDDALSMFRAMEPSIADWFVEGLESVVRFS